MKNYQFLFYFMLTAVMCNCTGLIELLKTIKLVFYEFINVAAFYILIKDHILT